MTTEYFNVRNGFSVGEDTFTVEASTGDVVVGGNLTVNGTTTTLNTTQLEIEDNIIVLNKNVTGNPTLDAGIAIERGQGTDAALTWNETTDKWEQNRGGTTTVIPVSTTELAEGSNQYFTAQRAVDAVEAAGYATETQVNIKLNSADFTSTADSWLGTKSTTNLAEGTNKYYTDARVRTEINAGNPGSFVNLTASGNVELLADTVIVGDDTVTGYQGLEFNTLGKTAHLVIDHTTGKLIYSKDNTTWTPIAQSTTELAEGTNLYYTDARVGNYLSVNSWATQEYVGVQVANLIASAPSALNTLNELATALGNDANFATTVTTALGTKLATADFSSTANSWLSGKTTSNLSEGTNLYYTDTRARGSVSGGTGISYNNTTGVITNTITQYTDALARGAISAGTGVGYDSGTGIISIGQSVATSANPAFAGITAGNLTVGVATDNSIVSTDTNGNITLAPNGTGNLTTTFNDGGNLTNNRNYVFGAVRNATQLAAGDIGFGNLRGISLDNSSATTKRPGIMIRSYGGGLTSGAPRSTIGTEAARGTAAVPVLLNSGDVFGEWVGNGYTSTGWSNEIATASPAIARFATAEAWDSGTAKVGSRFQVVLMPASTTYSLANLRQVLDISPDTFNTTSDLYTLKNKSNTTNLTLSSTGDLVVTGDVRVNGNNIQGSGGLNAIDLTSANTLTTVRANATLLNTAADVTYASISGTGQTFTSTGRTNLIRTTPGTGLLLRQQTANADPANNDEIDFRLGVAGTSTSSDWARFDGTYKSSGDHEIGMSVSTDSFVTNTDKIYIGSRASTKIRATPAGGGTASDILAISDAKILNNRPHRGAVTTATLARGGTYTPAAGTNNFIELTLTTGTDPTYIDVDNLTVAGEGGHQAILVYNNSGSTIGVGDLRIRNNGTQISDTKVVIPVGGRIIATVYCIGNYASCEIMDAA